MQVSFIDLALAALFGYAAIALFLWVAQARIIFGKPTRLRPLLPGPIDSQHTVQPLRLAVTRTVQLEGWASRPLEAQQRKVLIYFGGRNEHVGWRATNARKWCWSGAAWEQPWLWRWQRAVK